MPMPQLVTAALLASALAGAPAAAGELQPVEFTLRNGLKVVLAEEHSVPNVCLGIAFRTGSRNERPGITGVSHLFEHMMFNGSRRYPAGLFDLVLEGGGGYSNAYTSRDLTFYYEEFLPHLLDTVLAMEADRMRGLRIDRANLEQERGIVMEERRLGVDNSVPGSLAEALDAAAFAAHPYRTPVIGWMRDLETVTPADARGYYDTWYVPNNATLVVVGSFNASRARRMVEGHFGTIPARRLPRTPPDPEPPQRGEKRVTLHMAAELPALMIGWKMDAAREPGHAALQMLAVVLGHGESSRLHRRLVYEEEICTGVDLEAAELRDPGLFTLYAQVRPGRTPAEAEAVIAAAITALVDSGVTAAEAAKALSVLEKQASDDLVTHAGTAGRLAFFDAVYGSWKPALDPAARFSAVTPEAIRDAARRVLTDRRKTVVLLVPERAEERQP